MSRALRLGLACAALAAAAPASAEAPLPPGFVHLSAVAPGIRQDIRYATARNFMGRPAAGYLAAECVLTAEAAEALGRAHAALARRGLALVVWDCYRPQRAVADFMAWSRDAADTRLGAVFYPAVDKRALVAQGYLSPRSAHARGSTVDVGIARAGAPWPPRAAPSGACTAPSPRRFDEGVIDFGTSYDCFDARSHGSDARIGAEARANRRLLRETMQEAGFRGYAREWWHFQLVREPFPTGAFDFPVPPRR